MFLVIQDKSDEESKKKLCNLYKKLILLFNETFQKTLNIKYKQKKKLIDILYQGQIFHEGIKVMLKTTKSKNE